MLQAGPVLDLVLADEGNPRGLAFQLVAARDMLIDLDGDAESPLAAAAGQLLEDARDMVREVIAMANQGAAPDGAGASQPDAVTRLPPRLRARVLGVQASIGVAFLGFILFTSNPFLRLDNPPFDGRDLNPLLQDPGLAFHPPFLYLGYVGLSMAFSFAVAALIEAAHRRA